MGAINKILKEIEECETGSSLVTAYERDVAVEKIRALSTIALTESLTTLAKILKKALKKNYDW